MNLIGAANCSVQTNQTSVLVERKTVTNGNQNPIDGRGKFIMIEVKSNTGTFSSNKDNMR